MAQQPMYPAVNNSVPTLLSAPLTASATTIAVQSVQTLGAPPNLVTLGEEDNAEVVRYSAIEGNTLVGCVRGFSGTAAQIWPASTAVYRAYTAHDHAVITGNIEDLAAHKLDADGNAAFATVSFSQAAQRAPLSPGESLGALLGKLSAWYSAFGDGAWASFGDSAGAIARGNHTHAQYAPLDADGKVRADAACAKSIPVDASRALALDDAGRCLDVTGLGAITLTLPTHDAVPLPVDAEIEVYGRNTGRVTFAAAPGVWIYTIAGATQGSVKLAARHGVVTLKKKAANEWLITGELG